MSSISSIAGNGQALYAALQGASVSASSAASDSATAPSASSATSTAAAQGHRHRHHHGGGEDFKKIEAAVTTVLQSVQSSGASADPNQVIQDAIAKLFSAPGGASAPSSPTVTTADATDPTAASRSQIPAVPGGSDADDTSRQAFFQMLKSFGVDPTQFHDDVLAALKGTTAGQLDPSTAFRSFPPGSIVDTSV